MAVKSGYHHGDLRRALLEAAKDAIEESGPAALSLRDLARRVGVSHAAPAHHFGDKRGLMTALATEGFGRFAAELGEAYQRDRSLLDVGVAYVSFALRHRAAFEVMFRPDLHDVEDPELVDAKAAARETLSGPMGEIAADDPGFDPTLAGVAAWSLVHGFATLSLTGNLPPALARTGERGARMVAEYLFRPPPARGRRPPTQRSKARSRPARATTAAAQATTIPRPARRPAASARKPITGGPARNPV